MAVVVLRERIKLAHIRDDCVFNDLSADWTLLLRHLVAAPRAHLEVETREENDIPSVLSTNETPKVLGLNLADFVESVMVPEVSHPLVL